MYKKGAARFSEPPPNLTTPTKQKGKLRPYPDTPALSRQPGKCRETVPEIHRDRKRRPDPPIEPPQLQPVTMKHWYLSQAFADCPKAVLENRQ